MTANATVVDFSGPPGSGKTVSAVMFCAMKMVQGKRCISNVDIHLTDEVVRFFQRKMIAMRRHLYKSTHDTLLAPEEQSIDLDELEGSEEFSSLPKPITESEDFDIMDVVHFDEKLHNTVLFLDELQNYADSIRFAAIMTRVLSMWGAQHRKFDCDLIYTVIDPSWIAGRLRRITEVVVDCMDVANSPWGKEEKVREGELIDWTVYDPLGIINGRRPFRNSRLPFGPPIAQKTFFAKRFWPCYETKQTQDIWETLGTTIKINKREIILDMTGKTQEGEAEGEGGAQGPGAEDLEKFNTRMDALEKMVKSSGRSPKLARELQHAKAELGAMRGQK